MQNRKQVCLYRPGCHTLRTHQRDPTTVSRDCFDLLHFWPRPFRNSLINLETSDSSEDAILTQDLARTPDQHDAVRNRTPDLKPSSTSGLPVTGLQSQSRTPAERRNQN